MSNTKGWRYKRGEGIIQPEDMDCQGGSAPDELSFHLRNNKYQKRKEQ